MDASFEVLSGNAGDSNSEGMNSSGEDEIDELVNGEDVREEMEEFKLKQVVRSAVAGVGFAMSVVGIWGDGGVPVVIMAV